MQWIFRGSMWAWEANALKEVPQFSMKKFKWVWKRSRTRWYNGVFAFRRNRLAVSVNYWQAVKYCIRVLTESTCLYWFIEDSSLWICISKALWWHRASANACICICLTTLTQELMNQGATNVWCNLHRVLIPFKNVKVDASSSGKLYVFKIARKFLQGRTFYDLSGREVSEKGL